MKIFLKLFILRQTVYIYFTLSKKIGGLLWFAE